jgi:hypothetical protein
VQFQSGDRLRLFFKEKPTEETALDEFARLQWEWAGSPEHEVFVETPAAMSAIATPVKVQIGIRPHFERFARSASLELVGLTDAETGTTHTDAFKLITKPGEDARHYEGAEFWKSAEATFGLILQTIAVKPYSGGNSRGNAARLNALLPKMRLAISTQGVATALKLDEISSRKSKPLSRRIKPTD